MGKWKRLGSVKLCKYSIRLVINNCFYIEVNFVFFAMLFIMYAMGYCYDFIIVFASIALHEMGHVISALMTGKKVYAVKILPIGLGAIIEENGVRWQNVVVYSCGPFTNILLYTLCSIIQLYYQKYEDNIYFLMQINIYLAVFNLMPVLPLDGGKIFREILRMRIGIRSASKFNIKVSIILCTLLILLGIIQFLNSFHNVSILLIGIFIFFSLKSEQTEAALMNVKQIVYRRSRLLKKGIYPARDLVAIKSMHLGDIIKAMDFDRFHMVYVLDNDLKVLKIFTEQEILDAMLKYNLDMTFEEFFEISQ